MVYILGIIPARGGSKGIPNKNIYPLNGKPLIAHTIESANGSIRLNDCILSTDSKTIASHAADYGMICDSLRPASLATDEATTIEVVIHEITQYENKNNLNVDIVVLLQPTSPLRTSFDIDNSIDLFSFKNAESLISVYEATSIHPNIMYFLNGNVLTSCVNDGTNIKRRQDFRNVFVRNGAIYIATKSLIKNKYRLVSDNPTAYIMPRERSVNIDEPFDLYLAECLLSNNR